MVKTTKAVYLLMMGMSFAGFSQEKSIQYRSEYFVILVIDGPRYSETYGDSSCTYIPNLCQILKPEGTFFANFRNNGPTYTVPGHTAMTTGVYQRISNAGGGLPRNPSFFQYYLKARNALSSDAQIIASKGKLNVLSNTKNKRWKNKFRPYSYCGPNGTGIGYGPDQQTMVKVREVLSGTEPPHLMLINLLGVDVNGHGNDWKKYLENIQYTDAYALEIWGTIQANSRLKDKTTLFITNDHGRHTEGHKNGFVNHGDGCDGCRQISLLVLGPDIPKNREISTEAELIDIPSTIAEMMHLGFPTGKGRFLAEVFKDKR
jgi:predicted AlkP superfamily pyrophosphatase or phosphodiesterase